MMKAAGPTAADNFRDTPHYRRDAFREGLRRCGYTVGVQPLAQPQPHDVLMVWNRHGHIDVVCRRYEAAGAKVIVVENGYLGIDRNGHQLYAMALSQHLGAGTWPVSNEDRWSGLGIELKDWRQDGEHIVVLPQRGIGPLGVAMPPKWTADVVSRLRAITDRKVVVRNHPGPARSDPWPDLKGAWAAVTWASGAGLKSIVAGIPVFHELPQWIGSTAARFGIADLERPFLGDRLPMLHRLAHAQWRLDEIISGEPFRRLLA